MTVQPITVTIADACKLTGIARSRLYLLIKSGELPLIKLGRRSLIPYSNLKSFLEQKAA